MVKSRASKRRKSVIPVQLPEVIIAEILSKLPVKLLLKFKCVSKSWLALISSPEFVKTHLGSSANNKEYNCHRVILKDMKGKLKDCGLRSLLYNPITKASEICYPMKKFKIMWFDTANGLICLAYLPNTEKSDNYKPIGITTDRWPGSGFNLCIWNPSIRKWTKLPRFTWMGDCGPSYRYGFGYDQLHDDYKIVVMFDDSLHLTHAKIYSLRKDSWRSIKDYQGGSIMDCSAKCVKGKLYWSSSLSDHEYNIASFDLANETWDKVEQPDYGEGKFNLMLGVLGSDLVVLCNYERHHSDVWVMNDYGVKASWKKMFTISCPPDLRNYNFNTHSSLSFSPFFCQSYKGEVLLLYFSVFKIYNPEDDSIRQAKVTDLKYCLEAEIFVENLVNPLSVADQGHDNNED